MVWNDVRFEKKKGKSRCYSMPLVKFLIPRQQILLLFLLTTIHLCNQVPDVGLHKSDKLVRWFIMIA